MASAPADGNRFLTAPMGRLFLENALPMALVMSTSGLLNLIDAAFLGHFVGAEALAAVGLAFPLVMATIALATLVSGGMSSLFARHLGAGERFEAGAVFARAHGLALLVAAALVGLFLAFGPTGLRLLSGAEGETARMAHTYLLILICGSPVQFLIGVHADAMRNEGRAGLMALLSVGVALMNVVLDYVLIVVEGFGVAGSAWGTVAAQALGLALLVAMRLRDRRLLPLSVLTEHRWRGGWGKILALGLPLSLSFIGMALVSATVIATIRSTAAAGSADMVAAYGVVTRIFGLSYMPMMAIALATQSIVGNNVGAKLYHRSDAALRLALVAAFLYCLAVEVALYAARTGVGSGFVADAAVVDAVAAILRPMLALYLATGPILVLALYFQAVGQAGRAALLTLVKPFLISPVLVVASAAIWGPGALWFAFPMADSLVLALALALVSADLAKSGRRAGFALAGETR